MGRIAAIDLFSGAGGMSLGANAAGADVRVMLDFEPVTCDTAGVNEGALGATIIEEDITRVTGAELKRLGGIGREEPFIIIGGAPCQPFSKAAYWIDPGADAAYRRARAEGQDVAKPPPPDVRPDERRSLVDEYWRIVAEAQPDGFVFENVPSILHPRNLPILERFEKRAQAAGYCTTRVKANAADYGVPQKRERVFLLAAKSFAPPVPPATHAESPKRGQKPYVTAGAALRPFRPRTYYEPEEEVQGRWADHLREIPPGMNYKHHSAWASHPKPTFVAETRFWNFLLKLDPTAPSWTIPANPGPWVGPFHWESRRLRTVEMAAIQGFPKDFEFAGNRRERVRQIGNAVPPPLAEAMVGAVKATIEAETADVVEGAP